MTKYFFPEKSWFFLTFLKSSPKLQLFSDDLTVHFFIICCLSPSTRCYTCFWKKKFRKTRISEKIFAIFKNQSANLGSIFKGGNARFYDVGDRLSLYYTKNVSKALRNPVVGSRDIIRENFFSSLKVASLRSDCPNLAPRNSSPCTKIS